jgi:hypothetical protein
MLKETDIHASVWIQTRNPSKLAAVSYALDCVATFYKYFVKIN